MDMIEACMICEGEQEAEEHEVLAAWAHLIKTGIVWSLQGFYGRAAARLIEAGIITSDGDIIGTED
jgi:hypothetical protein